MSATAAPKRPRTARQLRTEQGVVDVRIVGCDPRLVDGAGDVGGSPPPEEPPARRRNGYGGGHELNWRGMLVACGLMILLTIIAVLLDRRERSA